MKWIIATTLAVLSLFASGNLYAQETLQAKVPFGFYVGRVAMPSGTYQIRPWTTHALLVRNSTKGIAAFYQIYSTGMEQNDRAVLVFHKYSASPEKYFLSEVRGLPTIGSVALPVSSQEEELRDTVRTVETVTIPQSQ